MASSWRAEEVSAGSVEREREPEELEGENDMRTVVQIPFRRVMHTGKGGRNLRGRYRKRERSKLQLLKGSIEEVILQPSESIPPGLVVATRRCPLHRSFDFPD